MYCVVECQYSVIVLCIVLQRDSVELVITDNR